MPQIEILIVGTNELIMQTIARLIDKDGIWKASICASMEEACETCITKDFELVLIGAGLSDAEEIALQKHLNHIRPTLPIVKHYGGGSGLLFAEIYQALKA